MATADWPGRPDVDDGARAAQDIAAVESGPRHPAHWLPAAIIAGICLAWSLFQLWIAYDPYNSIKARSWHLAFALTLAFLAYPALKSYVTRGGRSIRDHIPIYDYVLAAVGAACALFIWWDYENIVTRQGLPTWYDVAFGTVLILVLLEAARRTLGPALPILCILFLLYSIYPLLEKGIFFGNDTLDAIFGWLPSMPRFMDHRGIPLDFVINDMYLSDTGIFGIPLGVSTDFVFLFVLFGALLDSAGAGKYFIDVAFAGLGRFRGGPAKAAVLASGLTGLVSGSSIANTVTTGTFTIPLMKKVGLPDYKAGAVEVAASTNGQLMPPVMGAAAFIMAEILGIPYLDVVRAALIPALLSYIALFYVVHLEAVKLGLKAIPRSELPSVLKTFLRGLHYLIPLGVLLFYLIVLRRSPITSALLAIEALVVLMLVQRPIIALLALGLEKRAGKFDPRTRVGPILLAALRDGALDVWRGLIGGAKNMISVGVATAAAGIIVGVVTITGLVSRFVTIIDILSFGNIFLMLGLTAVTSLILGMGLPTTANYIVMASLTAPVILQLGADSGLLIPAIAAHLFVFYFGILADDTPPVGLAAYAAAAIARADPIRTGIQGFTYDMRTAILPFIFVFNTELLMISGVTPEGRAIWINDPFVIGWVFIASLVAMFAFAAAVQGQFGDECAWWERILLLALCLIIFRPGWAEQFVPLDRETVRVLGVLLVGALYGLQKMRARRRPDPALSSG